MPMTSMNLPGGLVAHGYQVVGSPMDTTGKVFYVSSTSANNADDPAHGKSPDLPFATWDYAIGRCTANKGDVIILMPGHVETVSAAGGLALDVAGITHWGLGHGESRPRVNFSATTSTMTISAASQTISNVLFSGTIDAVVTPILITGTDCRLLGIETRDTTGQALDWITATTASRMLISGWVHRGSSSAGSEAALVITGGDGITVENFWIDGDFSVAAIENVTTAATNLTIGGGSRMNYIRTRNSADVLITCVATTTGNLGPNIYGRVADHAANFPDAYAGDDMQHFPPMLICNLDGEAGGDGAGTASTSA